MLLKKKPPSRKVMDNDDDHGSQEQKVPDLSDIIVDEQQLPSGLAALLTSILDSPDETPVPSPVAPESGVIWRFHPGHAPIRTRMNRPLVRQRRYQTTQSPATTPTEPLVPFLWADRTQAAPAAGYIRPLSDPETAPTAMLRLWWSRDRTLTQWSEEINRITEARPTSGIVQAGYPADYEEQCWALLNRIQQTRWLARKVIAKLRNRVWMKRTQCNIDLIDMEPVKDRDAVHLTDNKHKMIYRFHLRDLFSSLMSNITMSDEMLPNPRPPTNPYTNAPLTLAQTIAVCQALLTDYAARGRCPPVLFAAFCAAGYDLDIFIKKNSSLLAQYAIQTYFKDVTPHNLDAVVDTALQLLTDSNIVHSPISVRRWLRQTPVTPLHREWLAMARDYTLYMNLHIQTRDTWFSESFIHADVRRLYERTPLPEPTSSRVRTLRTMFHDTPGPGIVTPPMSILPFTVQTLLGLPSPVGSLTSTIDDMTDAMTLLRLAMLGPDYAPQNRSRNQSNGTGPGGPPSV
jgi:hypothetical protein